MANSSSDLQTGTILVFEKSDNIEFIDALSLNDCLVFRERDTGKMYTFFKSDISMFKGGKLTDDELKEMK